MRAGQERRPVESNSHRKYCSSGYSKIKCNLLGYFPFDIDSATFVMEGQKNVCLVFLKQPKGDSEIALLRVASC